MDTEAMLARAQFGRRESGTRRQSLLSKLQTPFLTPSASHVASPSTQVCVFLGSSVVGLITGLPKTTCHSARQPAVGRDSPGNSPPPAATGRVQSASQPSPLTVLP